MEKHRSDDRKEEKRETRRGLEEKKEIHPPGSKTLIAFVITTKIAVRWKNGAAPTVVPGILVVMVTSDLPGSAFGFRIDIYISTSVVCSIS